MAEPTGITWEQAKLILAGNYPAEYLAWLDQSGTLTGQTAELRDWVEFVNATQKTFWASGQASALPTTGLVEGNVYSYTDPATGQIIRVQYQGVDPATGSP